MLQVVAMSLFFVWCVYVILRFKSFRQWNWPNAPDTRNLKVVSRLFSALVVLFAKSSEDIAKTVKYEIE